MARVGKTYVSHAERIKEFWAAQTAQELEKESEPQWCLIKEGGKPMEIDSYAIKQDKNGDWMFYITQEGKEKPFDRLPGTYGMMSEKDKAAVIKSIFYRYQITIKERRKVNLVQKKVTLKLADDRPTGYILYVKGTDKFVYRLEKDVIRVTDNKKTTPVVFTKEDIEAIDNIDEFDVRKTKSSRKYIKNKVKA